ncbi:glycine zipper domain-containing protein [Denitromonas halophila]|uniref:Glycine zipper 2TM domain-containing protein n=1 Tax=Denitromonas halophila TaxID=1629404 RepID=A0A557QYT3_9RHOO|nr:glycine zipper domain-containing protein [Denitromonas halophila]TVO58069.1 glycine zipper 2TM domain-containing protein [Denitromonas halophila]
MRHLVAARTIASSIAVAFTLVSTTGCETTNKRDTGTIIGSVLGGILGNQVDDGGAGGTIIGALVGAAVGRMIGQYMDEADKKRFAETINEAPTGQTVRWHNDDSNRDFAVTPTSDVYAKGEQQCRRFDQVVFVDGKREVMEGVACKSPGSDALAVDGQQV